MKREQTVKIQPLFLNFLCCPMGTDKYSIFSIYNKEEKQEIRIWGFCVCFWTGLRMSDKMDVLKWQLKTNLRESIIPPIFSCIFRINILLHYCYTQFYEIFGLPLLRLDKNISQCCDCLAGKSVYINNNKELPPTSLKTTIHVNCRRSYIYT